MKKVLLLLCIIIPTLAVIAAEDYSARFIKSFSACEPVTETTRIIDAKGSSIPITKIVQGVREHKCVYKQVIIRPTVRDITTCEFPKPVLEEISTAMKEENGEKFNVELTINGENVMLQGLTKSQIIWTQALNSEQVCKREIIPR